MGLQDLIQKIEMSRHMWKKWEKKTKSKLVMVASTPLAHWSQASFVTKTWHSIDTLIESLIAIQIENELLKRRKSQLLPLQNDTFMNKI